MLSSMTGFGRFEKSDGERKITVEMRSVNHRYLDISIKMPKRFLPFESAARNVIKERIERGKVDVYVTYEDLSKSEFFLNYNSEIAGEYFKKLKEISREFGIEFDIKASSLSRYPDVLSMEEKEIGEDVLSGLFLEAIGGAADALSAARAAEGETLKNDILKKLDSLDKNVDYIITRSPQIVSEYRERITARIAELASDVQIDESRIAQEVTIFSDKCCVDEELTRLKSHIGSMRTIISSGKAAGRKLDFIAQEMNREANTTLSKSTDLLLSDAAIDLKTDIEKIREQVQNIE